VTAPLWRRIEPRSSRGRPTTAPRGQCDIRRNMLTLMSRLPDYVRQQLDDMANAVTETFSADSAMIDTALDAHASFGAENARSRSDLTRDLLVWAARPAASRVGLNPGAGPGGAFEVRAYVEEGHRCLVMRLRTAEKTADGRYRILAGNATSDLECESLYIEELWVLGFTRTDSGIGDLFVAEVLGVTDDLKVPQLILGTPVMLSTGPALPPPGGGFMSDDDDLAGFPGDEDDLDEGFGGPEVS
jgi:hypothetical protein